MGPSLPVLYLTSIAVCKGDLCHVNRPLVYRGTTCKYKDIRKIKIESGLSFEAAGDTTHIPQISTAHLDQHMNKHLLY